jgi:hypothetical protein
MGPGQLFARGDIPQKPQKVPKKKLSIGRRT